MYAKPKTILNKFGIQYTKTVKSYTAVNSFLVKILNEPFNFPIPEDTTKNYLLTETHLTYYNPGINKPGSYALLTP